MGLGITAFSHLTPVGRHTDGWCGEEDDGGDLKHIRAFAYDCFPHSFDGIPILARTVNGQAMLDGGCYARTPETVTTRFNASYPGYGAWRTHLAQQFNPYPSYEETDQGGLFKMRVPTEPDPDSPFYELIWFADNEGCIGPAAAARLLADFTAHRHEYKPHVWPDGEQRLYDNFIHAFELASNGGLVEFH